MEVKKTGLYEVHRRLGAKMVEFAGYYMPIQYSGILEEHKRVRTTAGVFDVSHMGEIEIRGPRALEMVNRITINDAGKLSVNQAQYSAMCYEDGGIVDDLLVYHRGDHYLLVVNASNTGKDFEWIMRHKIPGVEIENTSERITQLAVQGKAAPAILQKLTDVDLSQIKSYWFTEGKLAGTPMIISATGYTGEPGFELYFDHAHSENVWNRIFEAGKEFAIAPIGLGARDSLRLEKKYCLYGNDIDQTTNPLEAGLGWITKLDKSDFIGREALLKIKEAGLKRKLAGFEVEGKMIPRHGYSVQKYGQVVGQVTSGAFSPVLEKNIGLAYLKTELANPGETVEIEARGKVVPAKIVKTPFV
ncbi:MAG: glycine cleavage system aminomethyltransferase GcvT [Calditrichia bacterium]|nr:glycine cleavage system aminomethyltransferase GcvT [Calditrichia bacterium]